LSSANRKQLSKIKTAERKRKSLTDNSMVGKENELLVDIYK